MQHNLHWQTTPGNLDNTVEGLLFRHIQPTIDLHDMETKNVMPYHKSIHKIAKFRLTLVRSVSAKFRRVKFAAS